MPFTGKFCGSSVLQDSAAAYFELLYKFTI